MSVGGKNRTCTVMFFDTLLTLYPIFHYGGRHSRTRFSLMLVSFFTRRARDNVCGHEIASLARKINQMAVECEGATTPLTELGAREGLYTGKKHTRILEYCVTDM